MRTPIIPALLGALLVEAIPASAQAADLIFENDFEGRCTIGGSAGRLRKQTGNQAHDAGHQLIQTIPRQVSLRPTPDLAPDPRAGR